MEAKTLYDNLIKKYLNGNENESMKIYVDNFIKAYEKNGKISDAAIMSYDWDEDDKHQEPLPVQKNHNPEDYGTILWAIDIMKLIYKGTKHKKKILKFIDELESMA